jgi:large conductance mechanosensitive channel
MEGVKKVNLIQEFKEFLLEYKVLALAIAFIMGVASTALIKSLVDNIIMPPIGLILGGMDFKAFELVLKPATETTTAVAIRYGLFTNELINFIIIAFVVFMMAKIILKEEKVSKK